MNPKYLIRNPGRKIITEKTDEFGLYIMEFFCDTIQGEGISLGTPATFLRLQGCTLNCAWCDTEWANGRFYSFEELFVLMDYHALPKKLKEGQHLVITGGSPLKQQIALVHFFRSFYERYGFIPFIQIENECVLVPLPELISIVGIWNNSPKLENSGMRAQVRYFPEVIKKMSNLRNSYFKFVVASEDDWAQINYHFIQKGLIRKDQIFLMPLAGNISELSLNRGIVAELAVANNVRYTTREQLPLNYP